MIFVKFQSIYTVYTKARHWSLSCARCIESTPSHLIPLWSILLLSCHLCLGLPSGVFLLENFENAEINYRQRNIWISEISFVMHLAPSAHKLNKPHWCT